MSSSYGTRRRRERQRELGFFDIEGGLLSNLAVLLGGVAVASATWSEGFLWALAGFVVGLGIVSVMLTNRRTRRRKDRMTEWENLLSKVGLTGIEVFGLRRTSRGLRLELSLPARLTFPQVARTTEQIEGEAGLARGGVRVERDENAVQTVWLHATLRSDADRQSQPILPDPGQGIASVSNPLPIGVYDDGALCMVELAYTNTLVATRRRHRHRPVPPGGDGTTCPLR